MSKFYFSSKRLANFNRYQSSHKIFKLIKIKFLISDSELSEECIGFKIMCVYLEEVKMLHLQCFQKLISIS